MLPFVSSVALNPQETIVSHNRLMSNYLIRTKQKNAIFLNSVSLPTYSFSYVPYRRFISKHRTRWILTLYVYRFYFDWARANGLVSTTSLSGRRRNGDFSIKTEVRAF